MGETRTKVSETRSGVKAIAAVGLTLGLGYGAMLANHQTSSTDEQANLIYACFEHNITDQDRMCFDEPITTNEANYLEGNAKVYGDLGWLAFAGSAIGFAASIYVITSPDVITRKWTRRTPEEEAKEQSITAGEVTAPETQSDAS
ncbi:MAG: hypothetical protein WDN66_02350 [Candidatus Saccharibacteria bacterium]